MSSLSFTSPQRMKESQVKILQKKLSLTHLDELLEYYPVRYLDRRKIHTLATLPITQKFVQLRGMITHIETHNGKKKQLQAKFQDGTGSIILRWFHHIPWHRKKLKYKVVYLIWGTITWYAQKKQIIHPEMVIQTQETAQRTSARIIHPIYAVSQGKTAYPINNQFIIRLQRSLLAQSSSVRETLPTYIRKAHQLMGRELALHNIHFPTDAIHFRQARLRLKFEELFYFQLHLLHRRHKRSLQNQGYTFSVTTLLKKFYHHHLPFPLTEAQKRVFKDIYRDFKLGRPMYRLLQGDVGSGKTMVACLGMLVCVSNEAQVAFMVPTEILAQQHYQSLNTFLHPLGVSIAVLTCATPAHTRREILDNLQSGQLQVVVGTHALLNDQVAFARLGFVVIDEQHKFGVAQRAQLGKHKQPHLPHVLVMTATPIPRTLAMTLYGDLSISVLDQMPGGRKPIQTFHYKDAQRLSIFNFIHTQLKAGHQVYIVYPFIEVSQDQAYKDLMDGYESVCRAFPDYALSVVHGRMPALDKAYEMQRFVRGETQIMVATTVIEVGINVPQATVMVIEQAERFGLAQLHQLRGRVGRGSLQSYCLLVTGNRLSTQGRRRIQTMLYTTNGFEVAEVDLKLRGPGDFLGVRQSGLVTLKIANVMTDQKLLASARHTVHAILDDDPLLEKEEHQLLRSRLTFLSRQYSD